jgi:hypothetical protein
VLLADRQTAGGYPKVATIISAMLPRFVQTRAGLRVRFAAIGYLEEAVQAARTAASDMAAAIASIRALREELDGERAAPVPKPRRRRQRRTGLKGPPKALTGS